MDITLGLNLGGRRRRLAAARKPERSETVWIVRVEYVSPAYITGTRNLEVVLRHDEGGSTYLCLDAADMKTPEAFAAAARRSFPHLETPNLIAAWKERYGIAGFRPPPPPRATGEDRADLATRATEPPGEPTDPD